jgi:hypothetical protein
VNHKEHIAVSTILLDLLDYKKSLRPCCRFIRSKVFTTTIFLYQNTILPDLLRRHKNRIGKGVQCGNSKHVTSYFTLRLIPAWKFLRLNKAKAGVRGRDRYYYLSRTKSKRVSFSYNTIFSLHLRDNSFSRLFKSYRYHIALLSRLRGVTKNILRDHVDLKSHKDNIT